MYCDISQMKYMYITQLDNGGGGHISHLLVLFDNINYQELSFQKGSYILFVLMDLHPV